jgi:hypothetical protein
MRTQERHWDEPPSGASHVLHATDLMNRMAKIQLQELQIAVGAVPDGNPKSSEKYKKGIGSLFRRSKSDLIPNSPLNFDAHTPVVSESLQQRRSPPNDRYSVPKSERFLGRLKKHSDKTPDSENVNLEDRGSRSLMVFLRMSGTTQT